MHIITVLWSVELCTVFHQSIQCMSV